MQLTSSAFGNGKTIPQRYSGEGENISPPLDWTDMPVGTKSFALVMEDPDAPLMTFTHWVIYNLPAFANSLPENVPTTETLPDGSVQGKNTLQKTGYIGPSPPTKKPHRYYFKLFALDTKLALDGRASKNELLDAVEGHVLAEAELMGIYQKQ
jgi:hypothetical protein